MISPPGRNWRTPTGTGQTSAYGSMTKVGQAACTSSTNRCPQHKSDLKRRRKRTRRGFQKETKRWIYLLEGFPGCGCSLKSIPWVGTWVQSCNSEQKTNIQIETHSVSVVLNN